VQKGELKGLEIANGKLKAKYESPDGQVEVTIAGDFQGERVEGTYVISPKGSTEVVERGSRKVTKSGTS
jgi:hypothetical protein